MWFLFAVICWLIMPAYAKMSTDSANVINDVIVYGRIVCVFSFGLFLESIWTKVLQANGDMKTPMIAQIAGAVINIIIDFCDQIRTRYDGSRNSVFCLCSGTDAAGIHHGRAGKGSVIIIKFISIFRFADLVSKSIR